MLTFDHLFIALIIGLLIIIILMLYRVIKGPTAFDRLNGLGVIGTDTILLLILFGFLNKRVEMYVDIAIAYGILGFISLVVLAKYIESKGGTNR